MLDSNLINHKVGNIQNCLASIKTYTNDLDLSTLSDLKTKDAVVFNLKKLYNPVLILQIILFL